MKAVAASSGMAAIVAKTGEVVVTVVRPVAVKAAEMKAAEMKAAEMKAAETKAAAMKVAEIKAVVAEINAVATAVRRRRAPGGGVPSAQDLGDAAASLARCDCSVIGARSTHHLYS